MWQGACWAVTPSRSWAGERRMGRPTGWLRTPGTVTGETKVRQTPGNVTPMSHNLAMWWVIWQRSVCPESCFLRCDFRLLQDQAWTRWVWYRVGGGYRNPTQLDEMSPGCRQFSHPINQEELKQRPYFVRGLTVASEGNYSEISCNQPWINCTARWNNSFCARSVIDVNKPLWGSPGFFFFPQWATRYYDSFTRQFKGQK